jgi:glycogen debranching enzyme
MHELRRGELAHFKLIPHTPYYGTADATILYLIVLHNAWRCIGDPDLLTRYMPVAEKCLTWIDKYGDRDGDGFQEYQTRSKAGAYNQGWKDSGQALVDTDGSIVKTPIALVEIQGYVYDAWLRMAQIYDALGKSARAQTLRQKAESLFVHFNDAFWDEASGFYAFCLDGDKKQVLSVASNPGQGLWSGIVPPDRAAKVVERMMIPDMWSGWGIRRFRPTTPPTIRIPTRTAQYGRTTTASSHWAFAAMDSSKRRPASPVTSAARPAISCATKCRNSIRACSVIPPTFLFNTSAPMYHKPGQRDRVSPCFR